MIPIEEGSNYLVTEDGKVFSLFTKKFLKNSLSKGTGYYVVNVILDGKRRPEYIHRLVAKAYMPNPLNLPEVNHKRGKELNHKDNLEWVTEKQNLEHSIANKLPRRGKDHYRSKVTEEDVHKICRLFVAGWSAQKIVDESGLPVTRSAVLNIRTKRDWKEIGDLYTWRMFPERAKTSTTSRKA